MTSEVLISPQEVLDRMKGIRRSTEMSTYLADGVYASWDEIAQEIMLKTERFDALGNRSWHVIFLDADVLAALDGFREQIKRKTNN